MTTTTELKPVHAHFPGRNIMTPTYIGAWRTTYQGATAIAELTEGRGIYGQRIFGVTVRQDTKGTRFPGDDPSTLFYSQRAAMEYIANGCTKDKEDDQAREDGTS